MTMNNGGRTSKEVRLPGNEVLTSPTAVQALLRSSIDQAARQIVIVLAVPGSGGSLCAQVLSALGVDMIDDVANAARSESNTWTRPEIVSLHDRILVHLDREHLGPFHDAPLLGAWWSDPHVKRLQREISSLVHHKLYYAALWGFLDARTARLLPLWHQICRELRLESKFVLCLRNPAHVARDLRRHHDMDLAIGEYRWFMHAVDCFRHLRNHEICSLNYEDWFDDAATNTRKLANFLALEPDQSETELNLITDEILQPYRRDDRADKSEAGHPLIRSFYKLAQGNSEDRETRGQIARIADHFVIFQQLQQPLQNHLEQRHAASLARAKAAAAEETAALNSRIEEVTAALAARRDEVVALGEMGNAFEQTNAELRTALAEREAALAATASEAQADAACAAASEELFEREKAALRATLDEAENQVVALTAAKASAAEELAALNSRMEEVTAALAAERGEVVTLRETANALEQSNAELRTALAEREAALAATASEAQAHTTRAAALEELFETEKAALRATLDEAENQIAALAAAKASAAEELAAVNSRVEEVTAVLAAERGEVVTLREAANALEQSNAELRSAVAEREAALATVAIKENLEAPGSVRRGRIANWLRE